MTEKKIQRYNFKRPDRISKNQMRSLNFIHDRFARNVSSSMSAALRTVVEVSLENIVQISCADFLNIVNDPTCYAAVTCRPLDGLSALEIAPNLAFAMIDRLLGGVGRPVTNRRPMTEIEQKVIHNILRIVTDNLRESWKPVYSIDFSVSSIETHPHMAQITAPNEMVIHFQFQIRMRDLLAKMHLAIPTLVLEPIIHIFDQEEYTRKKVVPGGTLIYMLRNIPVGVSICTAESTFPIESLLSLQVGDTLVLSQWEDSPAVIKFAGKSKFLAKTRMDAGRRVFVVLGHAKQRGEEPHGKSLE